MKGRETDSGSTTFDLRISVISRATERRGLLTILALGTHHTKRFHAFELRKEWCADHWDDVEWVTFLGFEKWPDVDGRSFSRRVEEGCAMF